MNSSSYPENRLFTHNRLTRLAGLASLVAAVLIIASQIIGIPLVATTLPLSEWIKTAPYTLYLTLYNILHLSGFVLLLIGLVGLYARQSVAGGRLGLVGFLVAFTGTTLVAGDWWYESFAVPWYAEIAPQAVDGSPSGTLLAGGLTGFALFALGWGLFGIATFRARVFPRWAAIVLIIGGALGFMAGYPPFLAVLALGVGWMGFWLQTNSEFTEALPDRETVVSPATTAPSNP